MTSWLVGEDPGRSQLEEGHRPVRQEGRDAAASARRRARDGQEGRVRVQATQVQERQFPEADIPVGVAME